MQTTRTNAPGRRRRWIVYGLGIMAVLCLLLFGRRWLGQWTRYMGARCMGDWAIGDALQWLEWSAWLDPNDGSTELMRAVCFRHLGQKDRWAKAMHLAEQEQAPAQQIQHELAIALIQSGEVPEGAEQQLVGLIEAGVPQQDAVAAFVHGCLARDQTERAKRMLDAWTADAPGDAHNAFMWGVYWRHLNEHSKAITEFEHALDQKPCHELALTAIAESHEKAGQLDRAMGEFVQAAARSPANEAARLGLARVLRKLARADDARAVLRTFVSGPECSSAVRIELGQIELECGNYEEAERWFTETEPAALTAHDAIPSAATAIGLAGRPTRAERLFAVLADRLSIATGIQDLQVRLRLDPNDKAAADRLQRLSRSSLSESDLAARIDAELAEEDAAASGSMSGSDLYALHCSACHGKNGEGNGRAARYLFPKPRDLRTGRMRLISTRNAVPTREDVAAVLRHGMPGTSMRSFEDLSEEHQKLLVAEVLRLRREGVRDAFSDLLRSEGEEVDEEDVDRVVEHLTSPGEVVRAPRLAAADSQAMERGKALYFSQTCNSCHGDDGSGDETLPLFDDKGRATRARDLVREPFRGGHEPEAIYRRIVLGMPGTPHPASQNLSDAQLIDLVHYCRSLERQAKRETTNHQRAMQATGRAYLSALRSCLDDG